MIVKSVRCAIYTRKSSEEGLEQGFNSLDAQYEACAAYVLSQASEGWSTLPERYDDGGVSGGTLERPALRRLLADVEAGRIDTIVVYKVDRLSRSLFDFAKLVELFEKADTSFVSITQSFNTTSSMGRLTLNMLLSFAQFEREVTAERIRDKIAASKAKGMWMGGVPPLGYKPDGRSLAVVEAQASIVRDIFDRYLALGNVRLLTEALERERILTPRRALTNTRMVGGVPFSRGQLYKMLQCRLYLGEIPHKGQVFAGLHPAIVDRDTWDRVQAMLAANTQGTRDRTRAERPSLLAGRIVDEAGRAMISTHATRQTNGGGKVRYVYYASGTLPDGAKAAGQRIPAREVDTLVTDQLAALFDDPLTLIDRAGLDVPADAIGSYSGAVGVVAARIRAKDRLLIRTLLRQVRVLAGAVEIECDSTAIAEAVGAGLSDEADETVLLTAPVRLTRSGMAMRLIQGGQAVAASPDRSMIKLLARARGYWLELRKGELNIDALGERDKVSPAYITRLLRLAFLSPTIVEAILAGKQPAALSATSVMRTDAIVPNWSEQARMLSR